MSDNRWDAALKNATDRERKAYNMYGAFAKQAKNENVQRLFTKLALQELKHEQLLEEFEKTRDFLVAKEKVKTAYVDEDFMVLEELDPRFGFVDLDEAFQRGIHFEHEAAEAYQKLLDAAIDPSLRDLFLYLHGEEVEHERLLRKEYDRFKRTGA
jgi:rubrerythrin